MGLPEPVLKNRQILFEVMHRHGFRVDPVEWWHFNYAEGLKYELLDISPEEMEKLVKQGRQKRN